MSCECRELIHYYGVTISNNAKGLDTTFHDLKDTVECLDQLSHQFLKTRCEFGPIMFELKPRTKHLHLHALLKTDKPIRYKDWQIKGQQIFLRKCHSVQGWLDYIKKHNQYKVENDYWETQLNREYSFV